MSTGCQLKTRNQAKYRVSNTGKWDFVLFSVVQFHVWWLKLSKAELCNKHAKKCI